MSCGNHHDIDCGQILNEVYLFLDLECSDERRSAIQHHLDECGPCLSQYGIENEVKVLVARCCGTDRAPAELRDRLKSKIASLVVRPPSPSR